MVYSTPIRLRGALASAACVFSICLLPLARAQQSADPEVRDVVTVSRADIDAAREAKPGRVHGLAAPIPGAKEKLETFHRERASMNRSAIGVKSDAVTSNALTGPTFYPADLASGGGPTLATARQHAIYVNATGSIASNWGNPEGFLRDLNRSTFIHLADQYVGATENDRYPVGGRARVRYGTPGATLYESDIAAIVHAVAQDRGTGLGSIYHVFLPQGTDTCFDITPQNPTPVCYSPDNLATMAFCGYHDAVQFSDIGIVLFTVEPWQGSLCSIAMPFPNGLLVDSTNNVLSHETFETITDPLPGLGYLNLTGGLLTGEEIGDECVLFNFSNSPGEYSPPTFSINGKNYAVQLEYSDTYHQCASVP
jgi:hypothetical protein